MAIEENLVNYGVLGLWTITLLWERYKRDSRLISVIEKNTEALVKVTEMGKCKRS